VHYILQNEPLIVEEKLMMDVRGKVTIAEKSDRGIYKVTERFILGSMNDEYYL
jgi:hypothetical protein